MNISRGFRRLSLAASAVCLVLIIAVWIAQGVPPIREAIGTLIGFGALPGVAVFLVGWAVAGFSR